MDMSREWLHENLNYCPDTGIFTWKKPSQRRQMNKPIGTLGGDGGLILRIGKRSLNLNRAAWIYVHGELDDGVFVRHANGNKKDLRLANLYVASFADAFDNKLVSKNNKLREKNIIQVSDNSYRIQIWRGGKFVFIKQCIGLEAAKRERDKFMEQWRAKKKKEREMRGA